MMNPYHFNNPEIRDVAFVLAKALSDFDTIATAALTNCERRIAALETSKGERHDVAAPPHSEPIGLASLNAAPAHPGGSIGLALDRLEAIMARPAGKMPQQDPFPDHPKFHAIKGGRLG